MMNVQLTTVPSFIAINEHNQVNSATQRCVFTSFEQQRTFVGGIRYQISLKG